MAEKCEVGPASRDLDVEIFRVLHNLSDASCQDRSQLIPGSNAGRVVLRDVGAWRLASYQTPRFTSEHIAAATLYPLWPRRLPDNPLRACADALRQRAALAELGEERLPATPLPRHHVGLERRPTPPRASLPGSSLNDG